MTSRHTEVVELGLTQASRVMPVLKCSEAESLMVTSAPFPLNTSALPYLPAVVQVAAVIVPLLPVPEESDTVVPEPSVKA